MTAYRDPRQALRTRIAELRQDVLRQEARLTPALQKRLPLPLRRQLGEHREAAMATGSDLASLQAIERALRAHEQVLREVFRLAPKIDAAINELPDDFPSRLEPLGSYVFPDVYIPEVGEFRARFHERLLDCDPSAIALDRARGYFNTQEKPFLIEACFRWAGHPVRLGIASPPMSQNDLGYVLKGEATLTMAALLRRSAPRLRCRPQRALAGLLGSLGIRRDTTAGHDALDALLIIDGDPEDVSHVLVPEACTALMELAQVDIPTVHIDSGLAVVGWSEALPCSGGYRKAAQFLAALRNAGPVQLLAAP